MLRHDLLGDGRSIDDSKARKAEQEYECGDITLPRRTRAKDARSATRQRCGVVQLPHTIGRLL
jgi:hypothetical protein